jgi:hypothetical protein
MHPASSFYSIETFLMVSLGLYLDVYCFLFPFVPFFIITDTDLVLASSCHYTFDNMRLFGKSSSSCYYEITAMLGIGL